MSDKKEFTQFNTLMGDERYIDENGDYYHVHRGKTLTGDNKVKVYKQKSTMNTFIDNMKKDAQWQEMAREQERREYEAIKEQAMKESEILFNNSLREAESMPKKVYQGNQVLSTNYNPGSAEYNKHRLHTARNMTNGQIADYVRFVYDYLVSHEIPCDFDMTYYHDEIKKVKYGLLRNKVREERVEHTDFIGRGWLLDRSVSMEEGSREDEDITTYFVLSEDGNLYESEFIEKYRHASKVCLKSQTEWKLVDSSYWKYHRYPAYLDYYMLKLNLPISSMGYMNGIKELERRKEIRKEEEARRQAEQTRRQEAAKRNVMVQEVFLANKENKKAASGLGLPYIPDNWDMLEKKPYGTVISKKPMYSDYREINGVSDNPNIGDESYFARIRKAGTADAFKIRTSLEADTLYEVCAYYRVAPLKDAKKKAKKAPLYMRCKMDEEIKKGAGSGVRVFLRWGNESFTEIWSFVKMSVKEDMQISYVPGSAQFHNAGKLNEQYLSKASEDAFFTETGMKLGYDAQDGNVPEGMEYSGYITFLVYAQRL